MSRHQAAQKTSPQQDWHKADVKSALEKKGWSLRRLAALHEVDEGAVRQALRKPYPAAERRIADALGVHPMVIWPSRYDERGVPNRRRGNRSHVSQRPPHRNRSTRAQRGHGNSAGKN